MEKQCTKVKMCGMMRPEDILTANAVKPDFVGFIFAENRRRTVSAEAVREMKSKLDERIQTVGVFLNQDVHFVADTANACGLDYIQLHGSEDGEYIKSLKSVTQIPVIQAFVVKDETKIDEANASAADFVLLDSGTGSGESFSWEILTKVTRPYFLAGGLSPENAKEAIDAYHPYALDVSSGIETDGRKDPVKMQKFMQEVMQADKEETP